MPLRRAISLAAPPFASGVTQDARSGLIDLLLAMNTFCRQSAYTPSDFALAVVLIAAVGGHRHSGAARHDARRARPVTRLYAGGLWRLYRQPRHALSELQRMPMLPRSASPATLDAAYARR